MRLCSRRKRIRPVVGEGWELQARRRAAEGSRDIQGWPQRAWGGGLWGWGRTELLAPRKGVCRGENCPGLGDTGSRGG